MAAARIRSPVVSSSFDRPAPIQLQSIAGYPTKFKTRYSSGEEAGTIMSSAPVDIVKTLLANTSSFDTLKTLIAPDATYTSLNYSNPSLKKILPYAGEHPHGGPQAIYDTFATVNEIWANENFEILSIFGSGEDVAVFGRFTYRSRTLGQASTSPFSIWAKVKEGKVTYMQFMEDTLDTTATFKVGGKSTYKVFEGQEEFEV
ncbi:MAG: hypothetical protein Q9225_000361 [Loekoesia sp. 1 TL-2023]